MGSKKYRQWMSRREKMDRRDPLNPANQPRSRPGRKDRRRWCRGKPGVEHVTTISIHEWRDRSPCGWWTYYTLHGSDHGLRIENTTWSCRHIEQCVACGKILRHLDDDECPDKPES